MMEPAEIARLRLHNQRLAASLLDRPEEVVRWLGAVQSQDYAGAKWALAQRTAGVTDQQVDRAFNDGAILRTHMMRPTWHFVSPGDIRWILALTSPRVHAANAYYYRQLELDEGTFRRGRELMEKALQGGRQRTRAELAADLQEGGIHASGQRLAYLIMHAELDAVICSGPRRGKQFTYALLEERVPPASSYSREAALVELVRRYFNSHGPATTRDFAWWSGLKLKEANSGMDLVQEQFEHIQANGKKYWFVPPVRIPELQDPTIHFLPNYDEHLIAYKDRDFGLDPGVRGELDPEDSALIANILTRNGLVIGGWRRTLGKKEVFIETQLLVELDEAGRDALKEAARNFGRFLGMQVVLGGEPL